jgi:8-amino-7-oxononanoate synthase
MTTVPPPLQQVDRTYVRFKGRKISYFAGCDYFRLASHPKVLKAVQQGVSKYGLNVSASRLTTGNHELYGTLEKALAQFFGAESALLASNGYAPALMIAQACAGQYSHALIDERAHGCLVDAARLLDCPIIRFKHRNAEDLVSILGRLGKIRPIVMTDGMFSHDGSIAPIKEYLQLIPKDGTLLVDDSHAAGVLGKTGRGTPEFTGADRARIIQTITLSKAFGVYGGAVLGPISLKENIIAKSRIFVGNTPLPLPLAHAAAVSVNLLKADKTLRRRLTTNIQYFKTKVRAAGYEVADTPSPVVPVLPSSSGQAERLKTSLLKASIHPPFIKYPGGPESGYFRFVVSSEHTKKQLNNLIDVLVSVQEMH